MERTGGANTSGRSGPVPSPRAGRFESSGMRIALLIDRSRVSARALSTRTGCDMAATKKSTASKAKKSGGKARDSRCWGGYEPTPGKKPGTKGSCTPKD